jgi:hypothetical protein
MRELAICVSSVRPCYQIVAGARWRFVLA